MGKATESSRQTRSRAKKSEKIEKTVIKEEKCEAKDAAEALGNNGEGKVALPADDKITGKRTRQQSNREKEMYNLKLEQNSENLEEVSKAVENSSRKNSKLEKETVKADEGRRGRKRKVQQVLVSESLGDIQEETKKDNLKILNGGEADEESSKLPAEVSKSSTTSKQKKSAKKKADDPAVPRPVKYESLGSGPAPIPSTGCKYMGCHVSGAGGVWNAFENATECKAKSFALFLRNQRQWNAKPLDEGTVQKWNNVSDGVSGHLVLPHGSYLMNLGSPVPDTLHKSRNMLVEELQRCERLGIPHFNFHPGSTTGKVSREECCRTIADSINMAHQQTQAVICVLENMSCQGYTIGGDLHELRLIIENVVDKSRVGVCLDTCHAHAAGYDLSTEAGFNQLLEDFEKIIGWQYLRGMHINDSKGKAGDNLDRHENIGKGTIGMKGFERIMNCDHFCDIPLILETPWTDNAGYAKEIQKLEKLVK